MVRDQFLRRHQTNGGDSRRRNLHLRKFRSYLVANPRTQQFVEVPGQLRRNEIPVPVMSAFAVKYPRTIPVGAQQKGDDMIVVQFPPGAAHAHATFRTDGTFVSDD